MRGCDYFVCNCQVGGLDTQLSDVGEQSSAAEWLTAQICRASDRATSLTAFVAVVCHRVQWTESRGNHTIHDLHAIEAGLTSMCNRISGCHDPRHPAFMFPCRSEDRLHSGRCPTYVVAFSM